MKDQKNFHRTESGVSELIGALILISMIVLVVAIIAAGMISHPSADKVPQVRFSVVNSTKLIDGVVQPPYSISITHIGGDEISDGNYAVFVDGTNITDFTVNPNPDKKWSIGRVITVNSTYPPGLISVYYTGTNSPTLLGQRIIGNTTSTITTTYTITSSAGIGGSISPSGALIVPSGNSQTFTISSNTGYIISNVFVDGVAVGVISSYTFTNVIADHTISATFAATPTYIITASAGPGGSISPSGAVIVPSGNSQTFNITYLTGYDIADVQVDGSSVGAVGSYTFNNVLADHTITVSFVVVPTYIINSSISTIGGSITPLGTVIVTKSHNQIFNISAQAGYTIADVKVDGGSVGAVASYTFNNVVANHTIVASFVSFPPRTITSSTSTAGGSISPLGAVSVPYGGNQTFTISPLGGYAIADVIVDGVSAGTVGSYSFTNVFTDHTIVASFSIRKFIITSSAGANGAISPTGTTIVNYGATPTYTITPNPGYYVTNVLVNGTSVGAVTTYTFPAITSDKTISATFAINQYTIDASANPGGTISPSGTTTVNYGATPTYTFTPLTGYHISDIKVNGVSIGIVLTYTFPPVTSNQVIFAEFSPNAECPFISGTKWNDMNGNGIREGGEGGLANWQMDLYVKEGNQYKYDKTTYTNAVGYYIFPSIDYTKQYMVKEIVKPGYRATNPVSGEYSQIVVNPGSKCSRKDINFGNYLIK